MREQGNGAGDRMGRGLGRRNISSRGTKEFSNSSMYIPSFPWKASPVKLYMISNVIKTCQSKCELSRDAEDQ